MFKILLCFFFISQISADIESRNGRGQIPEAPNSNCTILEKEFGINRRDIRLPHEYDCTRFYECDDVILVEKHCADRYRTRYDPFYKICDWNAKTKCINYVEYRDILRQIGANQSG